MGVVKDVVSGRFGNEAKQVIQGQNLEALYTVEFGDVEGEGYRNAGIAIFETGRILGGDSGYYYVGDFQVNDRDVSGTARIVKHNPSWGNVFGDGADDFDVHFIGNIRDGKIEGSFMRTDKPGVTLQIRFTRRADLP